ncbi:MAG: MoxR family ATPase, partial [Saprospiraceae bacterium]|nr:MoxR family ATPase [Saprospiraceae bacterium]
RAPAKTQAALLEAMQEHRVTLEGRALPIAQPFMVLATQNPIEQEGTYPLPEAQLDRFMFNIPLTYPSYEQEVEVVKQTTSSSAAELKHILSAEQILGYQQLIRKIPVSDNVLEYAVGLATKTRPGTQHATQEASNYLAWGAGPRASQYLVLGAKCHAALRGKYSPDIEDVQAIANLVLRHRIVRNYKAEAEGVSEENIIEALL